MPVPTSEQLHAYAFVHEDIANALNGLTTAQLQTTPAPGEWSVQQILVHLADSESVNYQRLRITLAEDHPTLSDWDEERWASNLYYHQQDPFLALELFHVLRQLSTTLLQQLSSPAWERTAFHPVNGEMSVYDLFLRHLNHGTAHLQQIEKIKQQL